MRKGAFILGAGMLVLGMLPASPASAAAPKITVTRTDDPAPDGCAKTDCSLREAVIKANSTKDVEKIVLGPMTYTLTIATDGENAAATGDLDITRAVKIVGTGAATIEQQTNDRVLHVLGKGKLTLNGVTITGGDSISSGGGIQAEANRKLSISHSTITQNAAGFNGLGGGIYTEGPLTLVDSVVATNTSGGGAGGVSTKGHSVAITRSAINDNTTLSHNGFGGGGLYFEGPGDLDVVDSTVDGNVSSGAGGGGIQAYPPKFHFTLSHSTVSNNTTAGLGGGVLVGEGGVGGSPPSRTDILDSTITGNTANGPGGGLFCGCPAGQTEKGDEYSTITHTTITGNEADADNTTATADGGGVAGSVTVMEVLASIIAGNTEPGQAVSDCGDYVDFSMGSNITTESGCFSFVEPGSAPDAVAPNASFLQPLADNGGPTKTHRINPGSLPHNFNDGLGCDGSDQRGVIRPGPDDCDTGSYEYIECSGITVNVVGTNKADDLVGTIAPDGVLAQGGNDTVHAGLGNDKVCGGEGNDKLFGDDDADLLIGEAGDDTLDGGANVDECDGGPGKDRLINCES